MPQAGCSKGHSWLVDSTEEMYRGCPVCNQEAQERHAHNEELAELIAEKLAQKLKQP